MNILDTTIRLGTILKVLFWIFLMISFFASLKIDSTDKDIFNRSDLKLHIDNQTGCHYLTTWTGQIIPRMDKNGKQVCTGYEKKYLEEMDGE